MANDLICPDCGSKLHARSAALWCKKKGCEASFEAWDAERGWFIYYSEDEARTLEANADNLKMRRIAPVVVERLSDGSRVVLSKIEREDKPKGIHKDEGKLRVELVPMEGVHAAARAMSYGLVKYPAHNYRLGIAWASIYASIMRHLLLWFWDGRPDEESGLSHLDHAAADVLMLCAIVALHSALDDRPCKK